MLFFTLCGRRHVLTGSTFVNGGRYLIIEAQTACKRALFAYYFVVLRVGEGQFPFQISKFGQSGAIHPRFSTNFFVNDKNIK